METLISSYWNLFERIYTCNCSLIIEKRSFNRWMTVAAVVKLTQNFWKKGWLQLLFAKTNTLNKKLDPTVPRIKQGNLQRKKCFFRNKYFLDHHGFLWPAICLYIYFRFYQLIGWEHFLVSYHCSKFKYEQKKKMLYLRSFKIFSFKIFTYILNKVNFTCLTTGLYSSYLSWKKFFQPSMIAQNENFVN